MFHCIFTCCVVSNTKASPNLESRILIVFWNKTKKKGITMRCFLQLTLTILINVSKKINKVLIKFKTKIELKNWNLNLFLLFISILILRATQKVIDTYHLQVRYWNIETFIHVGMPNQTYICYIKHPKVALFIIKL